MPFDTTAEPETVRILKAAKARISDPANWCQGQTEDEDGRLCAAGAVGRCSNRQPETGFGLLDQAALRMGASKDGDLCPAAWLNDHTDHPTVMVMFDRAIELAWQEHLQHAD